MRAREPVRALSHDAQVPPPFNVQVVGMEKKRFREPASNNQAWWVERITGNKCKRDTCRWVWPERLGDDAA